MAGRKPLQALNPNLFGDWVGSSIDFGQDEGPTKKKAAARGTKKAARARRAQRNRQAPVVSEAATEDIEWLLGALERSSRLGSKVAIRPPADWRRSRRRRFLAWCEELDFTVTTVGALSVLEVEIARVAPLEATLREAAATRANATALVVVPTSSDRSPDSRRSDGSSLGTPSADAIPTPSAADETATADESLETQYGDVFESDPDDATAATSPADDIGAIDLAPDDATAATAPAEDLAAVDLGLDREDADTEADVPASETVVQDAGPKPEEESASPNTSSAVVAAASDETATTSDETATTSDADATTHAKKAADDATPTDVSHETALSDGRDSGDSEEDAIPQLVADPEDAMVVATSRMSVHRRRRTVAARRASMAPAPRTEPPRQKTCWASIAVGGWITGEVCDGRLVVLDEVGTRRDPDAKGELSVKTTTGWTPAWPRGRLYPGDDDEGRLYFRDDGRVDGAWPLAVVGRILEWLGNSDEVGAARAASRTFRRAADDGPRAALRARGCFEAGVALKGAPRGASTWKLLGEGAFKRVYLSPSDEVAVAVADLDLLGDDEAATEVARRELEIGFLLADLAQRAPLPNFAATTSAVVRGQAPDGADGGRFLYLTMELCEFGDLQTHVERQPDKDLGFDVALASFFQLCYALFAARAALAFRHYDLKLLNALAAPPRVPLRYTVGRRTFLLPPEAPVVKLADFGTSTVGAADLGAPTRGAIFSTIENAPPELLTHGDAADVHAFEADTFSLGLCGLHLLTGDAPYEEILHDAKAPSAFVDALAAVWFGSPKKKKGGGPAFVALRRVVADCCPDKDDDLVFYGRKKLDRTLFDTLYRYVVLLGLPGLDTSDFYAGSEVWRVVRACLGGPDENGQTRTHSRPARGPKVEPAHLVFRRDVARYSLASGDHPSIARARHKLDALPPLGKTALLATLDFDPRKRPTMRSILDSPLFRAFFDAAGSDDRAPAQDHHGGLHCALYSRTSRQAHLPLPDV